MCTWLLLLALCVCPSWAALPQFSWDTLPVFFHSANQSGQYNEKTLKMIAKFPMVTYAKSIGVDVTNVDDEDEMVIAMRAVKKINPQVATYFYLNTYKDTTPMTRMHRELQQHPEYYLKDSNGTKVKNSRGLYAYDLSNPKVRQWWQNICLNATKFANGDGCYADSSQHENATFTPSPSAAKLKAWGEGMLTMTHDVQVALGNDRLLIGKYPGQPYVKAAQIDFFEPNNNSINSLLLGQRIGQVVQAHVPIHVSCTSDLTDYIAAFLIGAGQYSYFGCGIWSIEGNDPRAVNWLPEYDKPLGAPKGPAEYNSGVWTRFFASGTKVMFNSTDNKGKIRWF